MVTITERLLLFLLSGQLETLEKAGSERGTQPQLFLSLSLEKVSRSAATMEDEEEIQSQAGSPASGSNGRITVTVAAAAPPPAQSSVLTLALPIQQVLPAAGRSGGGREDCWSEEATAVLIEAWGERYMELSRGNLKQKHWKEVADIVCSRCDDYGKTPKTDIQCKNRIDTVKKKYKLERAKLSAASAPSKWRFFDRLDHLIGPSAAKTPNPHHKPVPMGIPVGIRSYHPPQGLLLHNPSPNPNPNPTFRHKMHFRRSDSDSSRSLDDDNSPDSTDSFPPYHIKKPRVQVNLKPTPKPGPSSKAGIAGEEKNWGNSVKELTRAILKFGEVYEQAESSKLQQMVEMEKQRMKFAKEVELQRMQFFMKTQMEISQLRHGRRVGNNSNHHSNINNNNSDSSN